MPKVLMVSQPTVAGVAQCAVDWSAGLIARGWQAVVACPSGGPLTQWCEVASVPTVTWESERSPFVAVPSETRALNSIIANQAPDVVMLHSSKAGLDGRLGLRAKLPTVFVPHAWSFDAATGMPGRAALQWERLAAKRWTDLIICVSGAEYDRGIAAGIRGDYVVARNGVDVNRLRAMVGDRAQVRASLGVDPTSRLVVCLGRLALQKGQDVLLQAWPQVTSAGPVELALVGDGPDEQSLRRQAAGLAGVSFVGGVDRRQAVRWLAAADVVVVPSRWEGMALVPLEALAVGTPVVASDVTGVREAVAPEVGTLVPTESPGELAGALSQWLARSDSELAQVRAAAARRADQEFSLEVTVDTVARALRDCLR